jgi:hypothetical protein
VLSVLYELHLTASRQVDFDWVIVDRLGTLTSVVFLLYVTLRGAIKLKQKV